jgi:putative transposase
MHYPQSVILFSVFLYIRYAVSNRGLEEIMHEKGRYPLNGIDLWI